MEIVLHLVWMVFLMDQSVSSAPIRTSKVKQHWPHSALDWIMPLDWHVKGPIVWNVWFTLIYAIAECSNWWTICRFLKVRAPFPPWKIKILMQYLLGDNSQVVSNSSLRNFSLNIKPIQLINPPTIWMACVLCRRYVKFKFKIEWECFMLNKTA